ncbi:MAG: hypothetical protein QM786_09175 [Breznakibacter sp.]
MKKILTVISLSLVCGMACAQTAVTWTQLSNVTWATAYVASLKDYYDLPRFAKEIRDLDGKHISVKGFYVPVDNEGRVFALSANPSAMCFFCNGAGPESVMEINVKQGISNFKQMRADKFVELCGTLKLNRTDPEHLMYILQDAVLVQVIK